MLQNNDSSIAIKSVNHLDRVFDKVVSSALDEEEATLVGTLNGTAAHGSDVTSFENGRKVAVQGEKGPSEAEG